MFIQIPMSDDPEQNAVLARHLTNATRAADRGQPVLATDGPTWFEIGSVFGMIGWPLSLSDLRAFVTRMLAARYVVQGEELPINAIYGAPSVDEVFAWVQDLDWVNIPRTDIERLITLIGQQGNNGGPGGEGDGGGVIEGDTGASGTDTAPLYMPDLDGVVIDPSAPPKFDWQGSQPSAEAIAGQVESNVIDGGDGGDS